MTRDADIALLRVALESVISGNDGAFVISRPAWSETVTFADLAAALYDAGLRPSVEPDVGRVRLTMIDGIGVELSREFAQGSPFEPFDRIYVLKTITRVLDAARDRTRKAKQPSAEPAGVDGAWQAAEAALPKGGDFRTLVLSACKCKPEGCGQDYHAYIEGPNGEIWEPSAGTGNESPAAALQALVARLALLPTQASDSPEKP